MVALGVSTINAAVPLELAHSQKSAGIIKVPLFTKKLDVVTLLLLLRLFINVLVGKITVLAPPTPNPSMSYPKEVIRHHSLRLSCKTVLSLKA